MTPAMTYDRWVAVTLTDGQKGEPAMPKSRSTAASILVVCLVALAASPAIAVDCVDYGATLHWVAKAGGMQLFGGVERDGLYYGTGYPVLSIVDVADPRHPVTLGQADLVGSGRGVAVAGDYAYVAGTTFGLAVFDVSDPAAPALAAVLDTGAWRLDVALAGDHAFVSGGYADVAVIDIGDPLHPAVVATIPTPGYAYGLAARGDHLYVTDTYASDGVPGLRVYDISDPLAAVLTASTYVVGSTIDVAVGNGYAYVSTWNNGLTVYDLADPGHPVARGMVTIPQGARGLAVAGNLLHVASGNGLAVVDASDPVHPFVRAQVTTLDGFGGTSHDVAFRDGCALIANYGAFLVVDVTHPEDAPLAGSYALPDVGLGAVVEDGRLYVPVGRSGVHIAGLANPAAPIPLATLATNDFASDVAVRADWAVVADGDAGLLVADVASYAEPLAVAVVATPDSAVAVAYHSHYALVADHGAGLQVVDLDPPLSPRVVGALPTTVRPLAVAARSDVAYVAAAGGLAVVELVDPTAPQQVGWLPLPGAPIQVHLNGDLAYVSCLSGGVQVVDVTDPTAPHVVTALGLPHWAQASLRVGSDLYVADALAGVQVRRLLDPAVPEILGSADTPGRAVGLATYVDVLYVADQSPTLQLAALQCATTVPTFVLSFNAVVTDARVDLTWALGTAVAPGDLRLSAAASGRNWDVPFAAGRGYAAVDTPPAGTTVIYTLWLRAGDAWARLEERTVRVPAPAAARLVGAQPNPFNPSTVIAWELDRSGPVRIAVYDLRGREVAVLAEGAFAAGAHDVTWNGCDARGRAAAAGAYLVRLTASGSVATRAVMLLP